MSSIKAFLIKELKTPIYKGFTAFLWYFFVTKSWLSEVFFFGHFVFIFSVALDFENVKICKKRILKNFLFF